MRHHFHKHHHERHLRIFKDWKKVLIFAALSVFLAYISFYQKNNILKILNLISWTVLTFYIYKDIFKLTNLLDLSNDLILWILRIIGGIIAVIGLFLGGGMFFMGLLFNADPLSMGISILFFGLGFLGLFMLFRSHRRYGHIYVNR